MYKELFKSKKVVFEETEQLINLSNGDARKSGFDVDVFGEFLHTASLLTINAG